MQMARWGWIIPLVMLPACERQTARPDGNDATLLNVGEGEVRVAAEDAAKGASVSLPRVGATLKLPGIELGGDNMNIDGLQLFPGSKVSAINVIDRDGAGNSLVAMRFSSPAVPGRVAAHFAEAARRRAFSGIALTEDEGSTRLTANKGTGKQLSIEMKPDGTGATLGRLLIRSSQ